MNENVVLTLDDGNKYVVVTRTIFEDKEYLYLVDIENKSNFMFCELNGNKLNRVKDEELLKNLVGFIDEKVK